MEPIEALGEGLAAVGAPQKLETCRTLWQYAEELLRWNQRVNLTAITEPFEVVEKHLVDSLSLLPEVGAANTLLDLGAGAGLPGVPLAIALPSLSVTLADSVGKKVAFIKSVAVKLGLGPRVKALNVRADGSPDEEGLPRAEVVVSRALMDVEPWFKLASKYVADGGRVVAMTGPRPDETVLHAAAKNSGLEIQQVRVLQLPRSKAPRTVIVATPRRP